MTETEEPLPKRIMLSKPESVRSCAVTLDSLDGFIFKRILLALENVSFSEYTELRTVSKLFKNALDSKDVLSRFDFCENDLRRICKKWSEYGLCDCISEKRKPLFQPAIFIYNSIMAGNKKVRLLYAVILFYSTYNNHKYYSCRCKFTALMLLVEHFSRGGKAFLSAEHDLCFRGAKIFSPHEIKTILMENPEYKNNSEFNKEFHGKGYYYLVLSFSHPRSCQHNKICVMALDKISENTVFADNIGSCVINISREFRYLPRKTLEMRKDEWLKIAEELPYYANIFIGTIDAHMLVDPQFVMQKYNSQLFIKMLLQTINNSLEDNVAKIQIEQEYYDTKDIDLTSICVDYENICYPIRYMIPGEFALETYWNQLINKELVRSAGEIISMDIDENIRKLTIYKK